MADALECGEWSTALRYIVGSVRGQGCTGDVGDKVTFARRRRIFLSSYDRYATLKHAYSPSNEQCAHRPAHVPERTQAGLGNMSEPRFEPHVPTSMCVRCVVLVCVCTAPSLRPPQGRESGVPASLVTPRSLGGR